LFLAAEKSARILIRKINIFVCDMIIMKDHVAIMLRNQDGKILFIQRSMKKKTLPEAWSFPSGTVEEGEDVFVTASRETMKELWVGALAVDSIAVRELPEFSVRLYFVVCDICEGEVASITEPDEIDEIEWMSMGGFFDRFSDDEIGHGLVWLRANPDVWAGLR